MKKFLRNPLCYIAICLSLSACGGSSGTSPSPNPSPSPQPPSSLPDVTAKVDGNGYKLYYSDSFFVGQSTSIAATSASSSGFNNIEWLQTAGPSVELLAAHTQVISFDIPSAGSYSFTLRASNSSNNSINETVTFDAIDGGDDYANIRLDHAAVEQSKVSLRVGSSESADAKAINSVIWQQIAGTEVLNTVEDAQYLFFDAPNVAQDTVLEFSARINYSDGTSSSDNSYVLIKNTEINTTGYFPQFAEQIVTTDMFPYRPLGPHANELQACVYNNQISSTCSFNTLPLLGNEHESPTIEQVLERLLVSHQWMGDRFKQFLEQSVVSPDMLKLLRATTAIVISYDVRPSFYWTATGAIYLDAKNFWVTPQERDTLNDQPDYRGSFGDELQFFIPWRYVKDNDYYFRSSDYPVDERLTKSFDDLEANVSWLMYHELGHANDFFPPNSWASLSDSSNPLSYANDVEASSTDFSTSLPLTSNTMRNLAQVSFAGETATTEQKNTDAEQVATFFEPDTAPAYYSYSTTREDYATLFERFMMAYRLGVSADVAVLSSNNNDDLLVTWGQRDRISVNNIQPRVKYVVERILPELDIEAIQMALPAPQIMTPNVSWFDNILLTNNPSGKALSSAQEKKPRKPVHEKDYWHTYRHGPKTPKKNLAN